MEFQGFTALEAFSKQQLVETVDREDLARDVVN
jgi:hypothetical protein